MVIRKYFRKSAAVLTIALVVMLMAGVSPVVGASSLSTITMVSRYPGGTGVWGEPPRPDALSADGRISVFSTPAPLDFRDQNSNYDIYAYDRLAHKSEIISLGGNDQPTNGDSGPPVVSADGRYVAYATGARNIAGDNTLCYPFQPCRVIIVHDRVTKKNKAANVDSQGSRIDSLIDRPAISGDGRFVAFPSMAITTPGDTNNSRDILVRDMQTGVTTTVSLDNSGHTGSWASHAPSISGDGRFVSFATGSRLVPEDTNGTEDVYVRDTHAGTIALASVTNGGQVKQESSALSDISADGRFVVFNTFANLVAEDTNNNLDVYVRDLQAKQTSRVSVASNGAQANHHNNRASISGDGHFIAFSSDATNLVAADTNNQPDIFVHDRFASVTRRVNVASHNGPQAMGVSHGASISDDGKAVLFRSDARNIFSGPQSGAPVFLSYNPVAHIPFYDSSDILDLF